MLRALRRGEQLDREVDRELRFHLEMEAEKHQQHAGLTGDEARAAALRRFGGVQKTQEECRDARNVSIVDALRQDLRYGARTLRRSPGFAIAAIVTLGLGIGANVAIFSLIHGVLLEPLPYADSDRLLLVRQSAPLAGREDVGVSIKELYDYRAQTNAFDGLVEFHQMSFDLLKRGEPDRVDTGVVSHNFFDVLGVKPILGRTFVASDEGPSAPAVLVLSHSYWKSRFAADPTIVGQVLADERSRAHRDRRAAGRAALSERERRLHADVRVSVPRRRGTPHRAEPARVLESRSCSASTRRDVTRERAATDVETVAARFAQDHPNDLSRRHRLPRQA